MCTCGGGRDQWVWPVTHGMWCLFVVQHRRIEEEIKRKEAEMRDQEQLGMDSDEDSGVRVFGLKMYLNCLFVQRTSIHHHRKKALC